eukprot:m.181821 g.181821  ORF g.181821 m.181821 type:complete len:155 (+) comp18047_c0_seq1:86-550(+)
MAAEADKEAASMMVSDGAIKAAEAREDGSVPDFGVVELQADGPLEVEHSLSPFILEHLEQDARQVEASLTHLLGGLEAQLRALSSISLSYVGTYGMALEHISSDVDASIKNMSVLISQCGKISEHMEPVDELVARIATIKTQLDVLEEVVGKPA